MKLKTDFKIYVIHNYIQNANQELSHEDMIVQLNYKKFKEETYQLLRYELSFYLDRNPTIKSKIDNILQAPIIIPDKKVTKKHSFRSITTRRYYSGEHRLEIIVNGQTIHSSNFELI